MRDTTKGREKADTAPALAEKVMDPGTLFDEPVLVPAEETTRGTELYFDTLAFGNGVRPLVILPGLSDGLITVRGKGRLMHWYYRKLTDRYRVFIVSRPQEIPEGYSTRAMAADYAALFRTLGLSPRDAGEPAGSIDGAGIDVWGISQGGMISQWLGIEHPSLFRRMCLTVTTPGATQTLRETVGHWMDLANEGRYGELVRDTMRKTYTRRQLRKYAPMMPFLGLFGKPKSYRRFLIQAQSCIDHDARGELHTFSVPALILGGGSDRVVGEGTSEELSELIPDSTLKLYPDLGHGTYEEAGDAMDVLTEFFTV